MGGGGSGRALSMKAFEVLPRCGGGVIGDQLGGIIEEADKGDTTLSVSLRHGVIGLLRL